MNDPRALYEGFANTQMENLLVIALILFFFVILPLLGALRSRETKRRFQKRAEYSMQSLLDRFHLTAADQHVIRVLARYLNERQKPHLLLENQALFDASAVQAVKEGVLTKAQVSAVRGKLGFAQPRTNSRMTSSSDLPSGDPILLIQKGVPPVSGQICKQKHHSLCVRVKNGQLPFSQERPVEVVYHSAAGVYRFQTRVRGSSDDMVFLDHTSSIERIQRRRYYRAPTHLPVYVKRVGVQEEPVQSHFIDLSAGGSSLHNKELGLEAGEHIALAFYPGTERHLSVVGKVVRTSLRGRKAHISFRNLKPAAQDKLNGFVLAQRSGA